MRTQVLSLPAPSFAPGLALGGISTGKRWLRGTLAALMALFSLAMLSGCSGGKADQQMRGSWAVDVEALKDTDEFKAMPEAERRLTQSMLNAYANVRFEITADRMTMSGLTATAEELSYSVKSVNGTQVTIETLRSGQPGATPTRSEVTVEGDRMWIKMRNHTLVLRRRQ
ncbi:MAG: hypothetical protein ACE366_09245 [Bradymonadia bacterium]